MYSHTRSIPTKRTKVRTTEGKDSKIIMVAQDPLTPAEIEKFSAQAKLVYECFHETPRTMLEVSILTGVMRSSVCRLSNNWKADGLIFIIKLDRCPMTHRTVQFLSTNRAFWPQQYAPGEQLNAFQ